MIVRVFFIFFFLLCSKILYPNEYRYDFENNSVNILLAEKKSNYLKFGLHFNLAKGWKIYWIHPGESGSPPILSSPQKNIIQSIKIDWPMPYEEYDKEADLVTRIYKDEIVIPVHLYIDKKWLEKKNIPIKLDFQICKEICIPLTANFSLKFPEKDFYDKKNINIIKKYEDRVPKRLANQNSFSFKSILKKKNKIIIKISKKKEKEINPSKSYALLIGSDIPIYRNHDLKIDNDIIEFSLISSQEKKLKNKDITIFLSINNENYYFNTKYFENKNRSFSLLITVAIAFIGGVILNFMPCVLPILGLKINKLLNQLEKGNPIKLRLSSIYISIGIISTFLFFSIITIIFKLTGKTIGWGIQFQEPIFLLFLILILSIFALNLFGMINISTPNFKYLSIFNTEKIKNSFFFSNFFTGVVSTILATPCTAPFVGTAVSIALSQANYMTILIFLSMAVGKSLPYLLFVFYPKIIDYFPKPGKWMIFTKYFFGFLFILSIIWLASLFINHYTIKNITEDSQYVSWKKFEKVQLDNFIKNEIPVLVDITADWCITCKVNKKNVLDNKEIKKILEKKNIKIIRGDWTLPNEEIFNFLQSYGRYGIPFNIIFTKRYPNGLILNEILTRKHFLKSLDSALQ